MNKVLFIIIILIFICFNGVFAQTSFEQGAELYHYNKPAEARLFLEAALNAEPGNELIYYYLGIVYRQLNENEKAITILQHGLDVSYTLKDKMFHRIGLNFLDLEENSLAEEMFTSSININSQFAESYLDRANARIELEEYNNALSDYEIYLVINPFTKQRVQIEAIIEALKGFKEEAARLENEQLENEKALLNDVLNSLKNASDDAKNLSVDSDIILEDDDDDIDIDE